MRYLGGSWYNIVNCSNSISEVTALVRARFQVRHVIHGDKLAPVSEIVGLAAWQRTERGLEAKNIIRR